jgi:N-acetyl-alpha-D-muramate 1-phosphate uridylyltransferase
VAILAGGLGTRLGPLAHQAPKSMMDVNGRPFIAHQLGLLQEKGVRHVVVCAGFLGQQIANYVEDGRNFGLDVQYSFDGPVLLGTGGALKKALPLLGDSFFILYGDSYLNCDYHAVFEAFRNSKKTGLMTVFRNEKQWDTSNVRFSNGEILDYSKRRQTPDMNYIDYGLGLVKRSAFDALPANRPVDLAEVYEELLRQGQLAAFEVLERFYEIGSPQSLGDLSRHLIQLGTGVHLKESVGQPLNR